MRSLLPIDADQVAQRVGVGFSLVGVVHVQEDRHDAVCDLPAAPWCDHRACRRLINSRWPRRLRRHPHHPTTMDDLDHRLISLLRKDARLSLAALAGKLGVSRGTVSNRLRKLEDEQVIVGYTLRLRPDAEPDQIRAWMGVLVEGNQSRVVMASLLGEPGVQALHDTNGRWDLLAELRAGSMAELSQVLERIRLIKGIANTETSILLTSYR